MSLEIYDNWDFYILNSRYVLASCFQMHNISPSRFVEDNRKIFIYDLINQKLVFEQHFFRDKPFYSDSAGGKPLKIRCIGENIIEVSSESRVTLISLPLPFSKESLIKLENSSSQANGATLMSKEETNAAPLTTQAIYTPVVSQPVVSSPPSSLNQEVNQQVSALSGANRICSII